MRVILVPLGGAPYGDSASIPGAGRGRSARAGQGAGSMLLVMAILSRRRMRPGVSGAVTQHLPDQPISPC